LAFAALNVLTVCAVMYIAMFLINDTMQFQEILGHLW
jgi:hypothetical protein